MTDLSKLHQTALDFNQGLIKPRNGNTTLKIWEIVAGIQLKTKNYIICILDFERDKEYVFPMMGNILAENNITILNWNKETGIVNVFFENKKYTILFFTAANRYNVHYYDGFLVDFSTERCEDRKYIIS